MKLLPVFADSTLNGPIVPLLESRMNLAYATVYHESHMVYIHCMFHVDMIGRPTTIDLYCRHCGRTRR